jgi:hypothetical protein
VLDPVGVDRDFEGVVRVAGDLHGYPVGFGGDGYPGAGVAFLEVVLKVAERFVEGHDAALSGRWNLLHLMRLPVRRAVQPVPVRW